MLVNKFRDYIDNNQKLPLDHSINRLNISFELTQIAQQYYTELYQAFLDQNEYQTFEEMIKDS
jgi:poly(3-hydroxyalkanoate) synthetase